LRIFLKISALSMFCSLRICDVTFLLLSGHFLDHRDDFLRGWTFESLYLVSTSRYCKLAWSFFVTRICCKNAFFGDVMLWLWRKITSVSEEPAASTDPIIDELHCTIYFLECYNKRMLQRTVFINKIKMLQRTNTTTNSFYQ
jgi:hypothetical protein